MSLLYRAATIASVLASLGSNAVAAQTTAKASPADSAIIARERAAWNALKSKDAARFAEIAGRGSSIILVSGSGVDRSPADGLVTGIGARCEIRSSVLDDFTVERVSPDVVLLAYKVTLDRTCGTETTRGAEYNTTVWALRKGQWQLVSHSASPPAPGAR